MINKFKDIMSKKDKPESVDEITEEAVNQENTDKEKKAKSSRKSSKASKHKEEKEALEAQVSELKDKYIRLVAEFDNYKKRTVRERLDLMATAAQDTLSALLPILDDFDRAKKNAEDENSKEPFSEGVMLVYNKLYGTLKQRGLETHGVQRPGIRPGTARSHYRDPGSLGRDERQSDRYDRERV